ncbi:MAG: hypothetical protein UY63_C0017G0024 [Parcubacteria group bacterium GW2011_GWA2_51_10]|nr:MAG: hypothetical protein UY63_C0017G0024 [Parcubacteria group bacterium GW2011_GWA2_51_10]
MESPTSSEQLPDTVDLSEDFLSLTNEDFHVCLRKWRKVPLLTIRIDLSDIQEPKKFVHQAQRLKAFLEYKPEQQRRSATIVGRPEQKRWEENALGSGVTFEPKTAE